MTEAVRLVFLIRPKRGWRKNRDWNRNLTGSAIAGFAQQQIRSFLSDADNFTLECMAEPLTEQGEVTCPTSEASTLAST